MASLPKKDDTDDTRSTGTPPGAPELRPSDAEYEAIKKYILKIAQQVFGLGAANDLKNNPALLNHVIQDFFEEKNKLDRGVSAAKQAELAKQSIVYVTGIPSGKHLYLMPSIELRPPGSTRGDEQV